MRPALVSSVRKMVDDLAGVKAGETVLVVTDSGRDSQIAETVAFVSAQNEAEVVLATVRVDRSAPCPSLINSALKAADVVFDLTSDARIFGSKGRFAACARGTRYMWVPQVTYDMLTIGGMTANFHEQKLVVEKVSKRFAAAKCATMSTPAGTNISCEIGGSHINEFHGFCLNPGDVSMAPVIETNVLPIKGTANGILVVDLGIIYSPVGIVKEPVTLTVKRGKVVQIQGENEAQELKTILEKAGDPNVYLVCEFAIGLNPKVRLTGDLASVTLYGTAHFAIGLNVQLGGEIEAPLHFNLQVRQPTIRLDNELIMENGQLLI